MDARASSVTQYDMFQLMTQLDTAMLSSQDSISVLWAGRTHTGCERQKIKDMLMRVGFEPTPFRTSELMMHPKTTP